MKLLSTFDDKKISAQNHLIEMTLGEYADFAKDIIYNNDLQRKRVKTSNKSYSLLKDDIKVGCVIPAIVLATFPTEKSTAPQLNESNILDSIKSQGKDLIILDGLQRTYTILDLLDEVSKDSTLLKSIRDLKLKIEIYTGISKVGVLYRMLTLNTGQTPMSTRHQVEILYSDYKMGFDGLTFISEAEGKVPSGDSEYKFSDILDCFLSYITGNYLPIDSQDLVEIIKNLETLSKDDKKKDLFKELITTYNLFRLKTNQISANWNYDEEGKDLRKKPFVKTVNELFSKVQLLAGFGAASSFLIENGLIKDLSDLRERINKLDETDVSEVLNQIIKNLDEIQVNAKKIGNEQRMFFYYFVRSLFSEASEGYLNFEKSTQQAFKFYKANTLG